MARVNCDPYEGGHLFVLVNRLTCLLENQEDVQATVQALEEGGVATDDIEIFTGQQGAKCLDLFGAAHGRAVRLLRKLEHAMGNEGEANHRIDDALNRGATLVCVRVHKKKSDEKARALRVFQALHGHEIHFWGAWAFEDLASS
jgi:hypothetical protein